MLGICAVCDKISLVISLNVAKNPQKQKTNMLHDKSFSLLFFNVEFSCIFFTFLYNFSAYVELEVNLVANCIH